MNTVLADRVNRIKPSPTMAVNNKANELKAAGEDIINLTVGEPDFDTPDFVKQAGIAAIEAGFSKYTAVAGIPELLDAIIHKLAVDNRLNYERKQITVTSGAKQAIYNLAQAILEEGDEVIIPAPYWVSYPDIALLAGAKPVIVSAGIEQRFKINADQLAAAITDKTRLFFINSPSNPTGMAYTLQELQQLGEVLKKHPNILIVTDDIYEYILWAKEPFANIVNACPELKDRTIVLNGLSKSHCMTGWRVGYAAGDAKIIAAMNKIQSQSTSCACSISQKAAVAALNGGRAFFKPMLKAYKERHDLVQQALRQMEGIQTVDADGSFYVFADFNQVMQRLNIPDDIALGEFLLEQAKIATVPGSAFGAPGFVRFSVATSTENLSNAMLRLAKAIR